jgi:hypothetical protein
VQQHRLHCYLRSVQLWLPRIAVFCNVKNAPAAASGVPSTSGANTGVSDTGASGANLSEEERRRRSNSGNLKQPGASNIRPSTSTGSVATADASIQDRAVLRRHTQLVKQIMALLQRNAVMVFSDCAKDIKPVIEICEITSGDTAAVVLSQISKFCNRLTQGMEAVAGVANNRCTYDSATNTLVYAPGGEEADLIHSDAPVLVLEGSAGKGQSAVCADDASGEYCVNTIFAVLVRVNQNDAAVRRRESLQRVSWATTLSSRAFACLNLLFLPTISQTWTACRRRCGCC